MNFEAIIGAVTLGAIALMLFYGVLTVRRLVKSGFWRRVMLVALVLLVGWLLALLGAGEVHGQVLDMVDYLGQLGTRVLDVWAEMAR